MSRLLAAAALLASGCLYDFNMAEKIACPVTGECDTGFACLGGECVNSTRAWCTPGDRRCIGDVLWTCGAAGEGETGEDCAADGKLCASGACLSKCRSDGTCATGEQCDAGKKVCVPVVECSGDGQCSATRNEGCFAGVCVTRPTDALNAAKLSCYSTPSRPAFTFSGQVKRLGGQVTPASGALLAAGMATDVAFTADATGVFATAKTIEAGQTPVVRYDGPVDGSAALAFGLHYGPETQTENAELVLLMAMQRDDVRTLVRTEAPSGGPAYELKGRGILAGRVRDCSGDPLAGATVGYGVTVGRKGYLGDLVRRQLGQAATVNTAGSFVAFDAPVGVDFKVVVVALAMEAGGNVPVVVSAQTVRIEAPPEGFDWGVTLVSAGRGPAR